MGWAMTSEVRSRISRARPKKRLASAREKGRGPMNGRISGSSIGFPPASPELLRKVLAVTPENRDSLQVEVASKVVHRALPRLVGEIIPFWGRLHREVRSFEGVLHVDDEAAEKHAEI